MDGILAVKRQKTLNAGRHSWRSANWIGPKMLAARLEKVSDLARTPAI
jgi:hypothetical protein